MWDVSQTSGQPVALRTPLKAPSGEAPPGLWQGLCWLARREGFTVEREHGSPDDGATMWAARRIRIPAGAGSGPAAWVLAHQLGHVLLHNTIAHPPGTTTASCAGLQKAEAGSVAFIVCARYSTGVTHSFSHPVTWAGTDPRAQPAAAILAAGERITAAAARITRHLDGVLPGENISPSMAASEAVALAEPVQATRVKPAVAPPAQARDTHPTASRLAGDPAAAAGRLVLADAERFYASQLTRSWAPAYLRARGIDDTAQRDWRIGYAPAGWTVLIDHLHRLGHDDAAIQAAGLARSSSRGTLIDHFRDRLMLPAHDQHGMPAGFIGRTRPGSGPATPKYLNTPETALYDKSTLLFGLDQARTYLAQGACPVIVEGPLDAIAVSLASPEHYAGIAPCGTALTARQATLLSRAGDLPRTGVLVAFDDDCRSARRSHPGTRLYVRSPGLVEQPVRRGVMSSGIYADVPAGDVVTAIIDVDSMLRRAHRPDGSRPAGPDATLVVPTAEDAQNVLDGYCAIIYLFIKWFREAFEAAGKDRWPRLSP